MDSPKLPPIPTPFSQVLREFRIQVLPFIVFAVTVAAIVFLWRNTVSPVGIVGFVDTNQVYVTSLQDGLVTELFVERFQEVKKDQNVCVVVNTDPELVTALINKAKADLKVVLERSTVDIGRGRQQLQQLAGDRFTEIIRQTARGPQLLLAESNLVREADLLKSGVGTQLAYEVALAQRDALKEEIAARAVYIQQLGTNLASLAISDEPLKAAVMAAIKAQEEELTLTLKPAVLKAPIDGLVAMIHHQAGEKIRRGDPIVSIASPSATNVIGYVRQPIQRRPQPGDKVRVTTRTSPRRSGTSQIFKVGAQLEPINQSLLSAENRRFEVGLPIVVGLTPELIRDLSLMPGEFVDIAYE
jgi:multidrug resistance efflux pump